MYYKGSGTDPCGLYWIHLESHTDPSKEGMVGISKDPYGRFIEHFKKPNRHLKYAIDKYGEDNILLTLLLFSTQSDCLLQERMLRPEDNIGWNIVTGGGLPPSQKGVKRSEETKALISLAGVIGGPKGYSAQIESMGRDWWINNVCAAGGRAACLSMSPEKRSSNTKGKVWCNDGNVNLRRYPEEVPAGYSIGRLKTK